MANGAISTDRTRWALQRVAAGLSERLSRAFEKKKPDRLAARLEANRFSILSNRFRSTELALAEAEIVAEIERSQRSVHQAGSDIAAEGDLPPRPMFVVSGWACRLRVLGDGRRQILGFFLPGDAVGLRGRAEPLSGASITALTTVETVDAATLVRIAEEKKRFPGIAEGLTRIAVQQDSFTDSQIVRLGVQNDVERLASLMQELRWRLSEAGLECEGRFEMPVTLETLGDALGLTARRVQKALASLRGRRMASLRYGRAELLAPIGRIGDFRSPDAFAVQKN